MGWVVCMSILLPWQRHDHKPENLNGLDDLRKLLEIHGFYDVAVGVQPIRFIDG